PWTDLLPDTGSASRLRELSRAALRLFRAWKAPGGLHQGFGKRLCRRRSATGDRLGGDGLGAKRPGRQGVVGTHRLWHGDGCDDLVVQSRIPLSQEGEQPLKDLPTWRAWGLPSPSTASRLPTEICFALHRPSLFLRRFSLSRVGRGFRRFLLDS